MNLSNETKVIINGSELKSLILQHLGIEIASEEKQKVITKSLAANALAIFSDVKTMSRELLVKKMCHQFECGMNKVTNAGGLLRQLQDADIIAKDGRSNFKILIDDAEDKITESNPSACREKDVRFRFFIKEGTKFTVQNVEIVVPYGIISKKKQAEIVDHIISD